MLKKLIILCILNSILVLPIVQSAKCPDIQTMQNFEPKKYVGKWYELERYPFIFESLQKCITAEYTLNSNGTVGVTNTGYTVIGEYPISISGLAVPEPGNPSNLTVTFHTFSNGKYWVLDTDYTTYSLVYSCYNLPLFSWRYENAWILGRNKDISAIDSKTMVKIKDILKSKGSSTEKFSETTQNCDN